MLPPPTLFPTLSLHDALPISIVDPRGFRPLVLGRLGRGWVVASETCALDITGATLVRELEPGAFIRIDRKSTRLNSSHTVISYAVFCLKKKKQRPSIHTNSPI